jgi:hypothetical protein
MYCFYNPTPGAVGICKHCQRGLCPACAADVDGDGLACRDRHEAQVRMTNRLVSNVPRNASRQGAVLLGLGVVTAVIGLFMWAADGFIVAVAELAFAVFCLLLGGFMMRSARHAQQTGPDPSP